VFSSKVSFMSKSSYIFTPFKEEEKSDFDRLFEIFSEIIPHTSGDVEEALDWMKTID